MMDYGVCVVVTYSSKRFVRYTFTLCHILKYMSDTKSYQEIQNLIVIHLKFNNDF